jgi:hypothetical protein
MTSGGSARSIITGSAMSALAMVGICCSRPDIVTAFCFRRCFSRGKISAITSVRRVASRVHPSLPGCRGAGSPQRSPRRDAPLVPHIGDAPAEALLERPVEDIGPREGNSARPFGCEGQSGRVTGQVRQVGRRPGRRPDLLYTRAQSRVQGRLPRSVRPLGHRRARR